MRNTVQKDEMNAPLLPLLVFYISGIVINHYFFIPFPLLIASFLVLSTALICVLLLGYRKISHIFIFLSLTILGIFSLYPTRYPLSPSHIKYFASEKKRVLEGILYRTPDYSWNRTRIYLKLCAIHESNRSYPINGKFLLTIRNCRQQLDTGDRIRFLCKVSTPKNFGNPGCSDYVNSLAREGVFATGFMANDKYLAVIGNGFNHLYLLKALKKRIRKAFTENLEPTTQGIALALVLGERKNIPPALREEILMAGIAHLFAISGLHIGIIATISYLLIRWLLTRSYHLTLLISVKKWSPFFAIFPVLFYALLTGWNLPTQRAVIMIVLFLISIILGKKKNVLNTLYLAAFIILIVSPSSLFDISFQLSFVSVFFLIYLIPKFSLIFPEEKFISKLQFRWEITIFSWLKKSLFATIAASLGTTPLVSLYFNRISLIGIISNLILIPLLGVGAVCVGLLIAVFSLISPPLTLPFLRLDEQIINSSIILIKFFAHLPLSELRVATPSLLEIIFFYTSIFLLCNLKKRTIYKYAFVLVILLLGIDFLSSKLQDRFNHNLRLTFLDGGQGESILIEFPYGGKMLIDGGGSYQDEALDIGERAIAPYLWKKKIKKLDYILLTHPHPDHLNGLPFIARNFKPTFFWWNGEEALPPLAKKLYEVIGYAQSEARVINNNIPRLIINGTCIDFLHPPPSSKWNGNNNSLVLRIVLGEISFLLTGDIQKEAESEIIQEGKYLKSTVMKVPHHGSKTSSSEPFIEKVSPKVAVFTGKLGKFLPNSKIIQRYEEKGIQTIKISERGAVIFFTDGKKLKMEELKSGIITTIIP